MTPEEMARAAEKAGLDGVVITEHDTLWRTDELAALQRDAAGLKVFAGMEVSCREGHFLAIGIESTEGIYYDMPASKLIELAHGRGAAIIAAHPYRYDPAEGDLCYGLDIDGVEVDSSNTGPEASALAKRLARAKGVPEITSSDSHSVETLGRYFTEFPDDASNAKDVARSVLGWKGALGR